MLHPYPVHIFIYQFIGPLQQMVLHYRDAQENFAKSLTSYIIIYGFSVIMHAITICADYISPIYKRECHTALRNIYHQQQMIILHNLRRFLFIFLGILLYCVFMPAFYEWRLSEILQENHLLWATNLSPVNVTLGRKICYLT